jgi:uncharacterized protein
VSHTLIYFLWFTLLVVAMIAAWFTTLFAFPGNWLIVALSAVFAFFYPGTHGRGVEWITVGLAVLLAAAGEVIELFAGAAGAKKAGASRRSMVLAIFGTMIGSITGAAVGVPIPVVGPIIGALGGGALGAFGGAFVGEAWKGRDASQSFEVGKGALVGRVLGTAGKLAAGAAIIVIVTVDGLF